jgi:PAS domain S-box-containing protein
MVKKEIKPPTAAEPIEITSEDELGKLALSFNKMQASLNSYIQELNKRNVALKTINTIADKLYRSFDVQTIAKEAVESIAVYTNSPRAVLFEIDEDKQVLNRLYSRGFSQQTLDVAPVLPLEGSFSGIVVKNKQIVSSMNIASDKSIVPEVRQVLLEDKLTIAIGIPLLFQDKSLGVLNLFFSEHEHGQIEDYEREIFLSIGKTIGLAMANARHIQQIKAEVKERKKAQETMAESIVSLKAINAVADRVYRALDYDTLIDEALTAMSHYGKATAAYMYAYEERSESLLFLNAVGTLIDPQSLINGRLLVKKSLTGQAIQQKKIVISDNIPTDDRIQPVIKETLLKTNRTAAISIPLLFQDRALGAINLLFAEEINFTDSELETLFSIGKTIGLAMANARHIQQIKTEIQERKIAQEALHQSEEKYRTLIETTDTGFVIIDKDGLVRDANPEYVHLTGHHDLSEIVGRNVIEWTADSEKEKNAAAVKACFEKGYIRNLEIDYVDAKGNVTPIEFNATCMEIEGKTQTITICRDITERKQAEKVSRLISDMQAQFIRTNHLEEAYKLAAETIWQLIGDGYVTVGLLDEQIQATKLVGVYGFGNIFEKLVQMLGLDFTKITYSLKDMTEEELKLYRSGKLERCKDGVYGLLLRKIPQAVCNGVEKLLHVNGIYGIGFAWNGIHFGGIVILAKKDISPLAGAIESIMNQAAITIHRLWSEKELQFRNLILSTQQEAAIDGILVVNEEGGMISSNRRFFDMWGIPPDIVESKSDKHMMQLIIDKFINPEKFINKMKYLYADRDETSQEEIALKDGRIFDSYSAPMLDAGGKYYGRVWYFRDITDHKQAEEEKRNLEERLQRAEKMEALGLLAGGVAHDLNNVLGVVVGYAEMLLDEVDESSTIRSDLIDIMNAGQRAAAIVQDLLTLARRGVADRKVINLNRLILDYKKSPELEKLFSYHPSVKIKTDLESDLLNIFGSSVHLEKTLFNLVSNASEAMPNGGIATIKTINQYLDKPVHGYDNIHEGDYVVLSVSDTGKGIPESDLKRIFEPFYTKKIMGRSGTGLGLAVVWGTVKDHQGYINVESEEGKGTTFTLYFPVTKEEITAEVSSVSMSEYMGNGESILVVDDVKGQRDLAAAMLKKLNYKVKNVSSGKDAVAYLKKHKVDLLVLDMIMDPGMDGLDTYKSVLKIHPKQKAIIVSGFSESDRVHAAQAVGAGEYVKKPYIIEKLGMAVRKELDKT